MTRTPRALRLAGLAAMAALAAGCSGGPATYPVKGTVTWKGKPVETGYVAFVSEDGQTAPATGKIVNGQYETRATPGWKRVQVFADYDKGYDKVMKQNTRAPLIPPDYNVNSQLRFEVQEGENTHDLKLP